MNWDQGSSIKPRASSFRVAIDHASLPGPPGFLDSSCRSLFHSSISQEEQLSGPTALPFFWSLLRFLATLHWSQGAAELGNIGISYLELLVMFELHSSHRVNV